MKTRMILVLLALTLLPSSRPSSARERTTITLGDHHRPALARQTPIEIVTDDAATGDGGNSWGGHQTRIVHTQDGIFTAYTVEGGGYFAREWRLATRQTNGTWTVVAQGVAGREPVNLLASADGTLHVIGWPNGAGTIWSGKPEEGALIMTPAPIPNVAAGYWPYNSAGIDEAGDLCILSSTGGEGPGGAFDWACYWPSQSQWITQTNELDYRYCYTYVFPSPEGHLSLVSTRDVRWEALGYPKPPGAFDYVFNAFRYWRTQDIISEPIAELSYAEEVPTEQFPDPYLNAQMDAYLDTKDRMHILYWLRGETTAGHWTCRHRAVSPWGALLYDVALPQDACSFSRIFQDLQERFYLLSSSGLLYLLGEDGLAVGNQIQLDLGGYEVDYSGFGLSVPRTGTPLSDVMDVVFPADGGTKWLYFQLDLHYTQAYLPLVTR